MPVDYEPIDLTAYCNAGVDLVHGEPAPIGSQTLRGLPFRVGPPQPDPACCFIACGRAGSADPVRIAVDATVRQVIFAHRLLDTQIPHNGPVGLTVATYIFHSRDGRRVAVPIRERFEIAVIPVPLHRFRFQDSTAWQTAARAFLAVPDHDDSLFPRYEGPWCLAGERLMEAMPGPTEAYQLWTWPCPHPDAPLEGIEIVPAGPPFLIAGITLGHVDEHPFVRERPEIVVLTLPQGDDAAREGDLDVDVDRGSAGYAFSLPTSSPEAFLSAPVQGWGEPLNPRASPAYAEIAAVPSATVTVRHQAEVLGRFRWRDLLEHGRVEASDRLRVEWMDRERNWVHTTVVDDATGRPVPCRIHFRSAAGVPYQPHGHHSHVNMNLSSWHSDVGGDLRLGQTSYAYIDGTCQGWLPRGDVLVEVVRGFEYEPLRTRVEIRPGQRALTLHLRRWTDMTAERWFSGDSHVHFLSTQGCHYEARAEDLNVVNLLLSQWGKLFTNTEEWTGNVSIAPDGRTIVYASQENRQHVLGHLTLLGLKTPVMPWCSDGLDEAEMGGTVEAALAHWADACHAQGGTVIIPHLGSPNAEHPALIATGRVDGVEMLWQADYLHNDYYRYLNCGYRLPLVGGTDKMSSETPVGIYRTYVYIPPEQEFSYENWCRNLARGRTFLSGGPILRFSVEGHAIGDTLRLPGNGGMVEVVARADAAAPIYTLQIVQAGRVVAETRTREPAGTRTLELQARVPVRGHSWLAARVGGPTYWDSRRTLCSFERGMFAHTSPIYIACGDEWTMWDPDTAQYMLTLIDGSLTYIQHTAGRHRPGAATHHHGEEDHQAYLERPFVEAREALHRRLHHTVRPRGRGRARHRNEGRSN